jgi:hypothetical protein
MPEAVSTIVTIAVAIVVIRKAANAAMNRVVDILRGLASPRVLQKDNAKPPSELYGSQTWLRVVLVRRTSFLMGQ